MAIERVSHGDGQAVRCRRADARRL
jgi:hypothetical protein